MINVVDRKRWASLRNRGYNKGSSGRDFNKMFIYCRKHTVETCYNKHGFPRHLQRSGVPVANSEMNDSYNHKED